MLLDARFTPILEFLKTSEFRTEINKLPGYDVNATGTVMAVREAFPARAKSPAKRSAVRIPYELQ